MDERRIQHGYGHDAQSRPHLDIEGSYAYHLRRYRKRYGASGISQRALAMVAHVSRWFVEHLETSPRLQASVEPLIRVAIALETRVEDLVAPDRYRALKEDVERRRRALGGSATSHRAAPEAKPAAKAPEFSLAAAYRSPHLVIAISDGKTIIDLRQYRVTSATSMFRFRWLIERECRAYGVREVIVEADTKTADYVYSLGIPHRTLTFRAAKQHVALCEGRTPPSDRSFFHALVAQHPELARYVKVLPATGRVATSERWRTSRLVVATLALAASAATAPKAPRPVVGRPPGRPERHRRAAA